VVDALLFPPPNAAILFLARPQMTALDDGIVAIETINCHFYYTAFTSTTCSAVQQASARPPDDDLKHHSLT
jgi:hypothetical protein